MNTIDIAHEHYEVELPLLYILTVTPLSYIPTSYLDADGYEMACSRIELLKGLLITGLFVFHQLIDFS